jgi:hypothetical protein
MSVVVCEQLGPVMGDQAISIAEAKKKHQRQGLFLNSYAKYAECVLSIICRICNNEYEYAEYGI